jgi:hypothetical protein
MTKRDPLWRETATDSELHDHLTRTFDNLRQVLYNAENTIDGRVNISYTRVLIDCAERTHDELIRRTDDRQQMDAVRPEVPEVADPLLQLVSDIEAAELRGDVTPEGGVILRPIPPVSDLLKY